VLKWVASKFRYIYIYDNGYVNGNRCVYKDKCIWDIGEFMKAKVNYLYQQNKDISTGAVADREKGSTTVDRATYVCIRILFHLITGRCFLAGYLEEFSFSLLRRRDEYLAFNN